MHDRRTPDDPELSEPVVVPPGSATEEAVVDPVDHRPDGAPVVRRRLPVGKVVRIAFVAIVLVAVVYWVYSRWDEVVEAIGRLSVGVVLAAVLVACVAAWTGVPAWTAILAGLGSRLRIRDSQHIFLMGQLGKYIPGGVWTVLAQAEMAKQLRVPRSRSGSASLMTILLAVVTSAIIGAGLLLAVGRDVLGNYWWALLLALPLLAFLHPGVLVAIGKLASKLTRRAIPLQRIPERSILASCGWLALGALCNGFQFWLLARAIAVTPPSLLLCIGLTAFAIGIGVVIVIAPAGAGVREGILVLGLTPFMDTGSALSIALATRLVMTIADFLVAGAAAGLRRIVR